MDTFFFRLLRSTKFRLISIFIIFVYFIFVLIHLNKTFVSTDEIPSIEKVDAKVQRLASQVDVGLHICNFPQFSFESKFFIVDCIVWFKFPAASESIKTIERFTIQSSFMQENGELLYRSAPVIKRIGNDVLVSYFVQTSFSAYPNFKNFPIGDHTLNIIIQNRDTSPSELCFVANGDNFTYAKKLFFSWAIKDTIVSTGFIHSQLHKKDPVLEVSYPVAVFSVNFEQNGYNHLFSLYLPLFILFFIVLLSLFFDLGAVERINTMVSVIPMLVLFKLVINAVAPDAGYLTHVDYLFFVFVFLSLLILFFQIYVYLASRNFKRLPQDVYTKQEERLQHLNDIVFGGTMVLLIIFATYAFFR